MLVATLPGVLESALALGGLQNTVTGIDRHVHGVDLSPGRVKLESPVATLPGAWRYRVSAGTGWPGVSIL